MNINTEVVYLTPVWILDHMCILYIILQVGRICWPWHCIWSCLAFGCHGFSYWDFVLLPMGYSTFSPKIPVMYRGWDSVVCLTQSSKKDLNWHLLCLNPTLHQTSTVSPCSLYSCSFLLLENTVTKSATLCILTQKLTLLVFSGDYSQECI